MSGPPPRDASGAARPLTVRLPPRVLDALGATPAEQRAAIVALATTYADKQEPPHDPR